MKSLNCINESSCECEGMFPNLYCDSACVYYISDKEKSCNNCYYEHLDVQEVEICSKCSDDAFLNNINCSQWKFDGRTCENCYYFLVDNDEYVCSKCVEISLYDEIDYTQWKSIIPF